MSTNHSAHWSNLSSWLVLVVGLTLVGAATLYMHATVERDVKREFDRHCNEIQNRITERLYDHARILRSGVAFCNASDNVTREGWRIYTQLQQVEQTLPGIQGIGFSRLIQPEELAQHIQDVRSEGFPAYTINPAGEREIYSAIIYLEPFDARNQRAFGYDMFSEPVRRAAMEQARDEDAATLSGKVVLVQETDEDIQAGMLMYVPVYRKGMPTDTVEQRRAALYGWVYSPYRMTDLLQGILGAQNPEKEHSLYLQIFDGAQPLPQNQLCQSSATASGPGGSKENLDALVPIDFNGHRWTLHFVQRHGGWFTAHSKPVWFILSGGTLISLLLFGLIRTLYTREEAQELAQELTGELRDERNRLTGIIQGTNAGTWEWNVQTGEVVFNDRWAQFLGYTLDELAPVTIKTWETLTHPDDLQRAKVLLQKHFSGERLFYDCECRIKHKDGHWVWIHDRGRILNRTSNGQPLMMFGTHTEISERKQNEEALRFKLEELQLWQTATVVREGRVAELKTEVNELAARLGEPPLYGALESSERKENS